MLLSCRGVGPGVITCSASSQSLYFLIPPSRASTWNKLHRNSWSCSCRVFSMVSRAPLKPWSSLCLLHGQLCSPKTVVLPEAASAGSLSKWQLRKLSCPLPFRPGPVLMLRSEDGKSSGKEQRRGRPGFPPTARASVPSGLLLAGEQLGRLSLLLR